MNKASSTDKDRIFFTLILLGLVCMLCIGFFYEVNLREAWLKSSSAFAILLAFSLVRDVKDSIIFYGLQTGLPLAVIGIASPPLSYPDLFIMVGNYIFLTSILYMSAWFRKIRENLKVN